MKVVLLGKHFVSHVTLPKKIYGQHRLSENREKIDRGRELYIEADENRWVIKKNDTVDIIADSASLMPEAGYVVLEEKHSYEITFLPSMEKAMLINTACLTMVLLLWETGRTHWSFIIIHVSKGSWICLLFIAVRR